MINPERRERKKQERRERILEVTRELILSRGAAGFTLNDVARELDLAKGTLYLSFPGKDDLLQEILMEAGSSFMGFLSSRVALAHSGIDAIVAMGRSYFEFYRNQEDAFILFGLMDYFSPAFPFVRKTLFGNLPDEFIRLVRLSLERGIADGSLDPELDAEGITVSIVFMATSLMDRVAKIPRDLRCDLDVPSIIGHAFSMLLRAVAHPAIPRKLIDRCFEPGETVDLSPYWRKTP